MRKITIWETKEVFVIITLDNRGIIHEIQVGTTLKIVNMIHKLTKSKETERT